MISQIKGFLVLFVELVDGILAEDWSSRPWDVLLDASHCKDRCAAVWRAPLKF